MQDGEQDASAGEDCPLFMTRMPAGENAALDAIAAIIDEDDEDAAAASQKRECEDKEPASTSDPPVPPLEHRPCRKKRGIGTMQVALALTGLEPSNLGEPSAKRSRS